jgi:hypothetical protein
MNQGNAVRVLLESEVGACVCGDLCGSSSRQALQFRHAQLHPMITAAAV